MSSLYMSFIDYIYNSAMYELGTIIFDHVISAAQSDEECQAQLISSGLPEKTTLWT